MKQTANFNFNAKLIKQKIIMAKSQQQQKCYKNLQSENNIIKPKNAAQIINQQTTISKTNHKIYLSQSTEKLKLKDYLLLRNLQKKSRSKRKLLINEDVKNKLNSSSDSSFLKSFIDPSHPLHKEKNQAEIKKNINYSFIKHTQEMKEKIKQKSEETINKLRDIQDYILADYKNTANQKQTYLFLFHIYNQLSSLEEISIGIGEYIHNHQNHNFDLKDHDYRQGNQRQRYFWQSIKNKNAKGKMLDNNWKQILNYEGKLGLSLNLDRINQGK